jgi:hypothetical protein
MAIHSLLLNGYSLVLFQKRLSLISYSAFEWLFTHSISEMAFHSFPRLDP